MSVARGHHIYKAVWTPAFGDKLLLEAKDDNEHDKYVVSVVRGSNSCVVGHVPRKDSSIVVLPEAWWENYLSHHGKEEARS